MERNFRRQRLETVKSKSRKFNSNKIFEEIKQEYGLKRIQFNPQKPSPNIFMNKLHKRMNQYYITLSRE